MQSGTKFKDTLQREVEMGQIEGPVLKALISFMYGSLKTIPEGLALPLFVAADAHQASLQVDIQLCENVFTQH